MGYVQLLKYLQKAQLGLFLWSFLYNTDILWSLQSRHYHDSYVKTYCRQTSQYETKSQSLTFLSHFSSCPSVMILLTWGARYMSSLHNCVNVSRCRAAILLMWRVKALNSSPWWHSCATHCCITPQISKQPTRHTTLVHVDKAMIHWMQFSLVIFRC